MFAINWQVIPVGDALKGKSINFRQVISMARAKPIDLAIELSCLSLMALGAITAGNWAYQACFRVGMFFG